MTVLLANVKAQSTAVTTLSRALANDRVHHAYLFDGPDGVGKELTALGLAQALVCEARLPAHPDRACGACSACRRALVKEGAARPVHPDIVVLERGLYEPAQIGRRTPETQDLSIDQVRTLVLARAAFPPHEGRAKVFLVRRAEELSVSAANALLKTLEEPGRLTHFVLMTSHPDALLPTILSRTQRVRFGALPDAVVKELLIAGGTTPDDADAIAPLAGGSMTAALVLADPDESAKREGFVERALRAIEAPDLGLALALAEDAKKQKDALDTALHALATRLARRAIDGAAARSRDADRDVARYGFVLNATHELAGNASPALVIESMMIRMRSV